MNMFKTNSSKASTQNTPSFDAKNMPVNQLLRTRTAHHSVLKTCNGARQTTFIEDLPEKLSVLEVQTYPDPSSLDAAALKQLTPPYHWHWYQEEYFVVTQGRFIFRLNGHEVTISATDPSPRVAIPPGALHTFHPDTSLNTPCVVEISASKSSTYSKASANKDHGTNERFFRNLYSYLEDCRVQGQTPSLPQILKFLDSAEVSLAWDMGPQWVTKWVSWGLGVVVGRWWGGYALGLKDSYPEYFDEGVDRKGQVGAEVLMKIKVEI